MDITSYHYRLLQITKDY